jgi:hypothetical protein
VLCAILPKQNMPKTIALKDIEKEYKNELQRNTDNGIPLSPDLMIDLSVELFQKVKTKEVLTTDEAENDMLLFQYGTNNWYDEIGEHFSFEIARQFILTKNQEFYQLRFTLIYEPEKFKDCKDYNSWSKDFPDVKQWVAEIKSTPGYKSATLFGFKSYQLVLDRI